MRKFVQSEIINQSVIKNYFTSKLGTFDFVFKNTSEIRFKFKIVKRKLNIQVPFAKELKKAVI